MKPSCTARRRSKKSLCGAIAMFYQPATNRALVLLLPADANPRHGISSIQVGGLQVDSSIHFSTNSVRLMPLSDCSSRGRGIFNHVILTKCVITHHISTRSRLDVSSERSKHSSTTKPNCSSSPTSSSRQTARSSPRLTPPSGAAQSRSSSHGTSQVSSR
jgi:hypothetical protein